MDYFTEWKKMAKFVTCTEIECVIIDSMIKCTMNKQLMSNAMFFWLNWQSLKFFPLTFTCT